LVLNLCFSPLPIEVIAAMMARTPRTQPLTSNRLNRIRVEWVNMCCVKVEHIGFALSILGEGAILRATIYTAHLIAQLALLCGTLHLVKPDRVKIRSALVTCSHHCGTSGVA
jgi:hypothetical protein